MRRKFADLWLYKILTVSKRRFAVSLPFRYEKTTPSRTEAIHGAAGEGFGYSQNGIFYRHPAPVIFRIVARSESVSILWLACVAGNSTPRDVYLANAVSRHTCKPRFSRKLHRHGDTRFGNRAVPRLKARGAPTFLEFINTGMDGMGT